MKYYLAIDLGASSGRHIIGFEKDGKVVLEEIHRFKTGMDMTDDGIVWGIRRLFKEIKKGIKMAFSQYPKIESISIDTWGVDYVLMNGNKEILPCFAYRNKRCERSALEFHDVVPFEELYKRTGIQYAPFNTIYQLYDDLQNGRLNNATDYLMLPSYFTYKLTGKKTHEYTEESTGAFIDVFKKDYDLELLDEAHLPRKLFKDIQMPGFVVGDLLPSIQKSVGGNAKVILCASHDTGSAFEAVDIPNDGILVSSGTWSLIGIKSKEPIVSEESLKGNYTNEGGVGYIRFLKNIMGMWINNELKKEIVMKQDYIDAHIDETSYEVTFDVNDPSLNAPKSMKEALLKLLDKCPPDNDLELFASIYRSMAISYKNAIDELERITGKVYKSIYIVGGGARNVYLNKLVEQYTKKKVIALPIEATSLGNIKIQMKASE